MTTDSTPPLPASLADADLVPWLVALDYGDADVMTNTDWLRILAPAYADKAAAVRALVEREREACATLVRPERFGTRECSCDTLAEDAAEAIRARGAK